MPAPLHIAIATSTRADWGLLSPLAHELRDRGVRLTVMATGMHLDNSYGHTVDEIITEGFTPMCIEASAEPDAAVQAAAVLAGFAAALREVKPDAVVILGDRFEMLSVATAATLTGVPIVHIAGGTVSEGAIDDNIRHAITKLSTLHLVETEKCARRVMAMGESPESVVVTGAAGVENIMATPRMGREALEESLGWHFGPENILATLHAETRGELSPREAMAGFLAGVGEVMEERPGLHLILTYPNCDVPPEPQIELMLEFERKMGGRVKTVPSLGRVRYMSALDIVDAVIGNSSGGIVEVPSAGVPVLDVGSRQRGREHGPGVIHCAPDRESVARGVRRVLGEEARVVASRRENPYSCPGTSRLMADAVMAWDFHPFPSKKFYQTSQDK
ncbi:MAG: UDP-N-acetylglucosamine 2-epimerase (hydrolyzing) [Muribaculaceae bacterium]|nr:UDP-N-acetylglucosamine 2-epimerase (hydrolyzing) [Muribaculaceae bacterium]